jgi:galactokinase
VRRRALALFGGPPDVLVVAPGRIEIVGNHVDYNGGDVLAAAVDRWIAVAARRRADELVRVGAADIGQGTVSVPLDRARVFDRRREGGERDWPDFTLAAVAALHAEGYPCAGVDLFYRGTIPLGIGLSSSSSLLTSLVAALAQLNDLPLGKLQIARIAQAAEHRTGAPVGRLDQTSAAVGGVLRFSNQPERVQLLDVHLGEALFALCDSNVRRTITDSRYPARVGECQEALRLLRRAGFAIETLADLPPGDLDRALALLPSPLDNRVQHVVEEVARTERAIAAIVAGDSRQLGQEMNASGRSSAMLYDISHPAVEAVVATAQGVPGVYGARMMGGGDGGAALVLADRQAIPRLRERLPANPVTVCRVARGLAVVR